MLALIDCNNFYVSCERLFRPDLRRRPVAVLSNNDGCIVARSPEVKALGVAMGTPLFMVRDQLTAHNTAVFSSNYTLYGDLSHRVMTVLQQDAEDVDVYSIDEAFLWAPNLPPSDWEAYLHHLRGRVQREVGIPTSIGAATTRTLAKLASRIAKKHPDGICALGTTAEIHDALRRVDVADIWGIGRKHAARLATYQVFTGADFISMPEALVRQELTVTGLRTHRELRGIPCHPIHMPTPTRRSMVYSRSLARTIRQSETLQEILARFASELGAKLRRHQLLASHLRLFLVPPRRSTATARGASRALPCPTADSRLLVSTAWLLLKQLHHRMPCRKVGLMALGLHGRDRAQQSLFTAPADPRLMAALDNINNRFGRGTLRLAAEGTTSSAWQPRREQCSPRYTTRWAELCAVNVDAGSSPTPSTRAGGTQSIPDVPGASPPHGGGSVDIAPQQKPHP